MLLLFKSHILSGSYNNFFKSFNRKSKQELMFECSREQSKPRQLLRPKRVVNSNLNNGNVQQQQQSNNGISSPSLNSKRNTQMVNGGKPNSFNVKDEVNVDNLDFTKKILHTSWHPKDNIIAIAATNSLYIFYNKENTLNSNQTSTFTPVTQTNSFNNNNTTNTFGNKNFKEQSKICFY